MKKFITIMIMTAFVFTSLPCNTYAMSKVKSISVSQTGSSITVTWKKAKDVKGYAVYRNGKRLTHVKTTKYTDKNVKSGGTYKYYIKPYKVKKLEKKQWYNTKTKKWTTKKPAKKYRGKSRKSKKVYGKKSPAKSITLKGTKPVAPTPAPAKVLTLTVSNVTSSKATLSWSGINAVGYSLYRNGQCIGWTETTSYTDTGLASGTAYTYYVACMDERGNEKEKSNSVKITTNTETAPPVVTEPAAYIDSYCGKRITMGQSFSEVKTSLINASNGYWTFTRVKSAECNGIYKDVTLHVFNINTYQDFLTVYVIDGKVVGWLSNSEVMGVDGDAVYSRGSKYSVTTVPFADETGYVYLLKNSTLRMALFAGYSEMTKNFNAQNEKQFQLYCINALRATIGREPLVRNKYLEGCELDTQEPLYCASAVMPGEFTTTGEDVAIVNQRYGAQAHAETLDASGISTRKLLYEYGPYPERCPQGPLAGLPYSEDVIIYIVTNKEVEVLGQNLLYGNSLGERVVWQFSNSALHYATMVGSEFTKMGIGVSGKSCVQRFDV